MKERNHLSEAEALAEIRKTVLQEEERLEAEREAQQSEAVFVLSQDYLVRNDEAPSEPTPEEMRIEPPTTSSIEIEEVEISSAILDQNQSFYDKNPLENDAVLLFDKEGLPSDLAVYDEMLDLESIREIISNELSSRLGRPFHQRIRQIIRQELQLALRDLKK